MTGFEPFMGFCDVFQRKHCFDQRPQLPLFDYGAKFLETLPFAREHDTVKRQVPAVQ
jgi:hypothetical protein